MTLGKLSSFKLCFKNKFSDSSPSKFIYLPSISCSLILLASLAFKSISTKCSNGENNNQSESFNARFRRLQYGQCHKLGTLYLSNYANEIAYREDTRRLDNKAIMDDILSRCLADNSISNEFCGYWQGNHRVAERLGA
ncbi:transposase [Campylobacter showae]|uniref:transposase n=1 Tax=Campylobacter showae TaxID=204 RepID=UPI003B967FBF